MYTHRMRPRDSVIRTLGDALARNDSRRSAPVSIRAEIARRDFVSALESEFRSRLPKDGFVRWFIFQNAARTDNGDPAIPETTRPDPNFAEEAAKLGHSPEVARAIEAELACKCAAFARTIPADRELAGVTTSLVGGVYELTACAVTVKLAPARYELLCARFAGPHEDLAASMFIMTLRYSYPRATSFYGTVPSAVFDSFGVTHECFASPLNCRGGAVGFSSPYRDTDMPFGSSGTFGEIAADLPRYMRDSTAVFELNPPFLEELMFACVVFAAGALSRKEPCACLLVFPEWPDSPALIEARRLPGVQSAKLQRGRHAYIAGEQYELATTKRVSYVDTRVFLARNVAGARLEDMIRAWT